MSDLESRLEEGIAATRLDVYRHWSSALVGTILIECLAALREKDGEIVALREEVRDIQRASASMTFKEATE